VAAASVGLTDRRLNAAGLAFLWHRGDMVNPLSRQRLVQDKMSVRKMDKLLVPFVASDRIGPQAALEVSHATSIISRRHPLWNF
jgi:hypothetical protein